MKKVWLLSLSLVMGTLIAALGLLGCQDTATNPADITTTEGYPSIGNPSPSAKAYPGVIHLTWSVVKDAKSYYVVRTDLTTKETVDLGQFDATSTSYADKVRLSNQLVDGQEYQYTVIAASGASTSALFEIRASATKADGSSIVGDGVGSCTVTANVPDFNTVGAIQPPDDFTIEKNVIDGGEFLEVYWTDKKDENGKFIPNFTTYTVTYYFGNSVLPTTAEDSLYFGDYLSYTDEDSTGGTGTHYVKFPLVGGKLQVKVESKWVDRYYATQSKTKEAEKTATYWYNVPSISAQPSRYYSRYSYSAEAGGGYYYNDKDAMYVSWQPVSGASSYSVYKTTLQRGRLEPQDSIDWKVVTGIDHWRSSSVTSEGSTSTVWTQYSGICTESNGTKYLYDSAEAGTYYVYMVIANHGSQKSRDPAISDVVQYYVVSR